VDNAEHGFSIQTRKIRDMERTKLASGKEVGCLFETARLLVAVNALARVGENASP
jgi:hypothetical protein